MHNFDLFGANINLTFRKNSTSKTLVGAFLSSFAIAFSIFAVFNFGIDIITKNKPISRFFKELQEESKIYFKNFPLMMKFAYNNKDIEDLDKYIVFRPTLVFSTLNKITGKVTSDVGYLYVEKCDTQKHFFGEYKDFITDKNNNFPIDSSWCLNPRKVRYLNGTIEERDDLNFMNEWGGTNANFFTLTIDICTTKKYPKNNCKPIEEIKKVFSKVYNQISFVDKFINLNNYTNSYSMYPYTWMAQLNYGILKSDFFKIKNIEIETDSGYVLEELSTSKIFQLDSIRSDVSLTEDSVFSLILESPKVMDKYNRRYVKIQDLIANVGGLIKSVLMMGKIICDFYSMRFLYFFISNKLLTIERNNNNFSISNSKNS